MAESSSNSAIALYEALEGQTVKDIVGVNAHIKTVIEIDSETKPIDAADTLWSNNILGAPVWDEISKKYMGFFDMRDILSAVVAANKAMENESKPGHDTTVWVKSFEEMIKEKDSLFNLTYLSARHPFMECKIDANLVEMATLLADPKCHRVGITNGSGSNRCVNIVSRAGLCKFLAEKVSADKLDEMLADAGLEYNKEIVCIQSDAPAFEAFEVMDRQNLSGLAVVDDEGKLVGNTSARDAKMAAIDQGKTEMQKDILSYLAAVRQTQFAKGGKDRYPVCLIHESDATVGRVLHLLAKTGYHRVFVTDEDSKPIGVVSVFDIIRFIVSKSSIS
mmetsp:Transcript_9964/g.15364  ORF Transcript_9964/g.15364 Transcript_9964/m.15364 type:complete len:334 (-) Transcript_9964:202-1203(-)|eukprot:CAMPEP_0195302278 /NCGR_PEP_ID=MMETSP0707-20130614/30824_1 /TAXON_ID=33640 /ORGANISM="Asterionellopsis glacialis, Strain CCMP134" /LENGTH=333 /DNA_ID=CAMNT_0040365483 /DNA_START=96 /DNA_END=1097 /DNA_ORIENTATION=+